MKKVIGLLPVRLESTRLPGKALKDVCGMPAIVHAYKRAELSTLLNDVYICTDSEKIKCVAESYNCKVIMTSAHRNGSERIYEASKNLNADIIINIQGDEVLVQPKHIDSIVEVMLENEGVEYTMGLTPFSKLNSPQDFKGITDLNDDLIYCSRSDIPSQSINTTKMNKVVFIVGFTKASLKQFVEWHETPLEQAEPNEFLRIIEHGHKIKMAYLDEAKISLDTIDDLDEIRSMMAKDELYNNYRG